MRFAECFWSSTWGKPNKYRFLQCTDQRFRFLNMTPYGKPNVIIAHVAPPYGEGFREQTESEVLRETLDVLRRMFRVPENTPLPELLDWRVTNWGADPFSCAGVLVHARGERRRRRQGTRGGGTRRRGALRGGGVFDRGAAVRPRRVAHRSSGGDGGVAVARGGSGPRASPRRSRGAVARIAGGRVGAVLGAGVREMAKATRRRGPGVHPGRLDVRRLRVAPVDTKIRVRGAARAVVRARGRRGSRPPSSARGTNGPSDSRETRRRRRRGRKRTKRRCPRRGSRGCLASRLRRRRRFRFRMRFTPPPRAASTAATLFPKTDPTLSSMVKGAPSAAAVPPSTFAWTPSPPPTVVRGEVAAAAGIGEAVKRRRRVAALASHQSLHVERMTRRGGGRFDVVRRTRRSVRSRREVTDDGSSERYRTRRCNVHRRAGTRVATCQTRQQRFFFTQFVSRRLAFGAAVSGARAAEMDVASERLGRLSLRDGRGGGARSDAAPSDDAWIAERRRRRVVPPRVPSLRRRRRDAAGAARASPVSTSSPPTVRVTIRTASRASCAARACGVSSRSRPGPISCAARRATRARFAETCARCRAPLHGSILSALGVKWHADCFRCSICDAPHVSTFVEHDGGAVCKPCHLAHVAERCAGCGEGIDGEFLRALGRKYHRGCFRCVECRADVSTSYLTHDDRPWCRACHVAVHAERCACGCGRGVEGSIVSALGKKYLDGHFRCAGVAAPSRTVPSCAWRPARVARRTRPCATRVTPRTTRRSARCARQRW